LLLPTLIALSAALMPQDTPTVKVGGTIFVDYTYQRSPLVLDTDSNLVHLSGFNVARAYINVTGSVSHVLSFRITPDIARESGTGTSLTGSLEFRLKYAYAQLNLDDWLTKGSWLRLGMQQTPWVDFHEGVYRYRFQGTVFEDREGFLSSSDVAASFKYVFPENYGDFHVGVYNGETYARPEVNDQKALQVRATLRPFAEQSNALQGLRASVFYDGDHYVQDAVRKRVIAALTYEHTYFNVGVEQLKAEDRTSATKPEVEAKGYSIWLTPRTTSGWEALARYDHLKPNTAIDAQRRKRTILGVAYWLPHEGNAAAAFLLDVETTRFEGLTPAQPKQSKISLHGLVNF
jgi:hypothetical protein